MTTRGRLLVAGAAGVGLLGATVFQAMGAGGATAPRPAAPSPAAAQGRVAAEGRVVTYPGADVVVGAERGGRVVRVLVEERQAVRRGELIAELEGDELRASLDEARARVEEAEAEVRLAELTLERRKELAAEDVVSPHDLDQARRDLEIARARAGTARATRARFEAQLRKTRVLAPLSGTVVARHVDAGETLEPGDPVVTVADIGKLRIDGEADEADAGALAEGAPVTITADGYVGLGWKGTVEEVGRSVTPRRLKPQDPARPTDTRVIGVKVAFAEPNPLKLGTTVELRIESAGSGTY